MNRYKLLDKIAGVTSVAVGLFLTIHGLAVGTVLPIKEGVDPFWFRIIQVAAGLLITYTGFMTKDISEWFGVK
jgi:hypothetical protein